MAQPPIIIIITHPHPNSDAMVSKEFTSVKDAETYLASIHSIFAATED
jgi:hypothetical protein